MKITISSSARCSLGAFAAAAVFTGCSGVTGSTADPGSMPLVRQSAATPGLLRVTAMVHSDRARSRLAPDAAQSTLFYISDVGTNDVYIYSYPKGRFEGALTGFASPMGLCADKTGNVFITNFGTSQIFEYAHGGTSVIATLSDPGYYPQGCAVDPKTGNLAVTNFSNGNGLGNVALYIGAKGSPAAHYTDSNISQMFLCGYDDKGNLFADGETSNDAFAFAELPRGSNSFTDIALNQFINEPGGGVQWNGTSVAIGDSTTDVIYRFAISGTHGTEVGSTSLDGAFDVVQFSIRGSKVVGPYSPSIGIWDYPAGGTAIKTIEGGAFNEPVGSAISVLKR